MGRTVQRPRASPNRGLTGQEAIERLARFGPNTLTGTPGTGLLIRILRQFHHPLIYVLLAAGAITAALGEYVDSAVIFAVVLANAVVGFIHESRAEAALEDLRPMVRTHAKVMRDGRERIVASDELIPGDFVLLEAGDKVPADAVRPRRGGVREPGPGRPGIAGAGHGHAPGDRTGGVQLGHARGGRTARHPDPDRFAGHARPASRGRRTGCERLPLCGDRSEDDHR